MKVSVLITNYNYARYVAVAIESVLAQTRPADEVIVVDDGSHDDSRAVLEAFSEKHPGRVDVVFQPNSGQAAAMNAGMSRCTGDVICLLDADDVWDREKLKQVGLAFEAAPSASMVMHRLRGIDIHGGGRTDVNVEDTLHIEGDLAPLMLSTGGAWVFGATSSLSLRRQVLERIMPIPAENWRLCADGAIAYAAVFLGPVVSLDVVLGSYRIHGANNHYAAGLDPAKVDADIEMTNRYINDFVRRIGRNERVDLMRNLHYRRDRFYRLGGGMTEAAAIARLILGWPLYRGPLERAKFLARFAARAAQSQWRRRRTPCARAS